MHIKTYNQFATILETKKKYYAVLSANNLLFKFYLLQGICTILFIQTSLAVTTEIPPTNSAASTLGSLYRSARDYRSEREPNPRCLKCALGALGYGDESR